MSVPKRTLDSSGITGILSWSLGQFMGYLERWIQVQEGYLALAEERWAMTKEQTPERIVQQNRHMDIQEQRVRLQSAKFKAEHGNWPGIDLEDNEPE